MTTTEAELLCCEGSVPENSCATALLAQSSEDVLAIGRSMVSFNLGLIVDKRGLPKNIHILSPLGAGLDDKAVHAVET